MSLSLEWKDNYLVFNYRGYVTIEDGYSSYDQLVADERFDNIEYILVDCRDVSCADYKEDDPVRHAAYAIVADKLHESEQFKVAIVVACKEVELVAKKIIDAASDLQLTWQREIFWDYEQAQAWASS